MDERAIISHIIESTDIQPRPVIIGPGDDLGMIVSNGMKLLAGVDQVIEGRHVRIGEDPEKIGYKAMARSLSDVAAMAARPLGSLATAAIPASWDQDRTIRLCDALRETAHRFEAPLFGGDIAVLAADQEHLVVTVTVLAEPPSSGRMVITRRGALDGDGIYMTGRLGGTLDDDGGGHHLEFTPRIQQALELSTILDERLHSMIDLSDGLGVDLKSLAKASELSAVIDASSLPIRDGVTIEQAIQSGEEYELLFSATGDVPGNVLDLPITRIGTFVTDHAIGTIMLENDGPARDISNLGWQHRTEGQ